MAEALDLTDQKYNRLTVKCREGSEHGASTWRCVCDCGNEIVVVGRLLLSNGVKSCGCREQEYEAGTRDWLKHGQAASKHGPPSRLYQTWGRIISKCENPNNAEYKVFGGKGVKVSPEWRADFTAFARDVGEPPPASILVLYPKLDGNFELGNCRWMSRKERSRLLPRKMSPRQIPKADLLGRRYGKLTVKGFAGLNKHSQSTWLCECDCGTQKVISIACLKDDPTKGTKSCGCLRNGPRTHAPSKEGMFRCIRCKEYRLLAERDLSFSYYRCVRCPMKRPYGSNPALRLWRSAKARAEKFGLPFTIRVEDIAIPTHCPVLGLELRICHRSEENIDASYSLDKIDPVKGYVPGNIAVISNRANVLKRDGNLQEFERLVAWLKEVTT